MTTPDLAGTAADTSDPKSGLRAIVTLRSLADKLELEQVEAALTSGMTWQDIADALGISRQAAHKKFSRKISHPTTRTRSSR